MNEFASEPLFVVMVDDDDEDVYSMRRAFSTLDASLRFESVSSSTEFFQLLDQTLDKGEEGNADPDLILLDLNLPTTSGFEILERLRNGPVCSLVPVVIFSTSDAEDDAIRSYQRGANAVFTKPASFDGTMRVAKAITAFWQTPGIRRVGRVPFREGGNGKEHGN
jgi:CheY-like chemotaxis protein